MSDKSLNPTKEHYGEVMALLEWLNRSFYDGALDLPMVTFRTSLKSFGCFVPKSWDHRTGVSSAEFRLNPLRFKAASLETKAIELMGLMEHLRQGKEARANYHDQLYARGMRGHGLRTHRLGDPDKETGERITLSVIKGGKFEKLLARKSESGFDFTWAMREEAKPERDRFGSPEGATRSGRRVKYACPQCALKAWARHEARLVCGEHMIAMEPTG